MSKRLFIMAFGLLLASCAPSPTINVSSADDVERGARLFAQGQAEAPPCSTCHRVISDLVGFSVGPGLAGIGERADGRVAGMSAEAYLRQSILEPHRYVVPGYRAIMYPDYRAHLTEQDIEDLITYLLTL
jgi:mono/diheme cytochrome c family protein